MKLPIFIYGNPLLRKISEDIDKSYPGLDGLIEDMYDTMYDSNGVGLAAPQIGKNIRLIVIDANPYAETYPDGKDFKTVLINPQIIEFSGKEWQMNEGCLSVPELREDVVRSEKILLEYYDRDFQFHTEAFDGIRSRIIQHEYDHLEGILFTDRISPIRKILIKSRMNDIAKGKVKPDYKIVVYNPRKK